MTKEEQMAYEVNKQARCGELPYEAGKVARWAILLHTENAKLRAVAEAAQVCLTDLPSGDLLGANKYASAQQRAVALRQALAAAGYPKSDEGGNHGG